MHLHSKDSIARKILNQIAKEQKKPFKKVKKLFTVKGHPSITKRFWELLALQCPNHSFTDVYHCPGCGQFDLE